jgi:hypothetical protein
MRRGYGGNKGTGSGEEERRETIAFSDRVHSRAWVGVTLALFRGNIWRTVGCSS